MEVKVIFRNKKQIHQCCHSFEIRDLSISPRVDLEQYKLKRKKKSRDGYGEGRTSSHDYGFRIGLNALCLWSDVSRGHGHLLCLGLLSEIVSLLIETGTYGGCGSRKKKSL